MLKYFGKFLIIAIIIAVLWQYFSPLSNEISDYFTKILNPQKPLILNDQVLCRYLYDFKEFDYNRNYPLTIKYCNQLIQAHNDAQDDPMIETIALQQYTKALNSWSSLTFNQAISLMNPKDLQKYLQKYINPLKLSQGHDPSDTNHQYYPGV
jgi:hypothetical protein